MNAAKFKLTRFSIVTAIISILSFSTLVQAKAPILPKLCTQGGSATVIIKSVNLGDGYYADMLLNGKVVSAYCDVGDCALLYDYGMTNVSAKVKLGYTYMEEYESTKTCKITDIEFTPDQKI